MASSNRWTAVLGLACVLSAGARRDGSAHEHTAPWLDESTLDGGLYIELRHPRVLRKAGAFDVTVAVNNLLGPERVTVRRVRYLVPGAFDAFVHPRNEVLRSRRLPFRQYQAVRTRLREAAERRDRASAERLSLRAQSLLRTITSGTLRDRHRVEPEFIPGVGETLAVVVEIDVATPSGTRTIRRTADVPVAPPLPSGTDGSWLAGDQHLHTAYSIDAFFVDGTRERVADYARTARSLGLDWIIVSDHTNIGFLVWYQPFLFRLGEVEARRFRNEEDYLVLQGQEMGVGASGPLGQPAHVLAYPRAADSTGFLPNPCPGLVVDFVNCEPEQIVLDRINDSGGLAFVAHPFDSGFTYAAWDRDSGAEGWAGLEIFNSASGSFADNDRRSIDWWYELLREIHPPRDGALAPRPRFPTRFPVGLGSSDAHQPGRIGNVFTYCRLPGMDRGSGMVPRRDLMEAFTEGRCVASNGPLVYGEVNGAGTGDVATVSDGTNRLVVTFQTTPELGPVTDYRIAVVVDGVPREIVVVAPNEEHGFEATVVLDGLFAPPDTFVTLEAFGLASRYAAIANPIWLEFAKEKRRGDATGSRLSSTNEARWVQ